MCSIPQAQLMLVQAHVCQSLRKDATASVLPGFQTPRRRCLLDTRVHGTCIVVSSHVFKRLSSPIVPLVQGGAMRDTLACVVQRIVDVSETELTCDAVAKAAVIILVISLNFITHRLNSEPTDRTVINESCLIRTRNLRLRRPTRYPLLGRRSASPV